MFDRSGSFTPSEMNTALNDMAPAARAFNKVVLGRFRRDTQQGMPRADVPTVPEMPAAKRASERPGSYSLITR